MNKIILYILLGIFLSLSSFAACEVNSSQTSVFFSKDDIYKEIYITNACFDTDVSYFLQDNTYINVKGDNKLTTTMPLTVSLVRTTRKNTEDLSQQLIISFSQLNTTMMIPIYVKSTVDTQFNFVDSLTQYSNKIIDKVKCIIPYEYYSSDFNNKFFSLKGLFILIMIFIISALLAFCIPIDSNLVKAVFIIIFFVLFTIAFIYISQDFMKICV